MYRFPIIKKQYFNSFHLLLALVSLLLKIIPPSKYIVKLYHFQKLIYITFLQALYIQH
jgi:hypothetical protein